MGVIYIQEEACESRCWNHQLKAGETAIVRNIGSENGVGGVLSKVTEMVLITDYKGIQLNSRRIRLERIGGTFCSKFYLKDRINVN